jgi:DNA-binding LacI/PurR family transcriptional regulator
MDKAASKEARAKKAPKRAPAREESARASRSTSSRPTKAGTRATARKARASEATPSRALTPKRRVTIKGVAEAAGVSIATVSFVLNNRPGQVISGPVRERVLEAARRLHYAPSAAAAGLARKRTANVAIFLYRNDHLFTNQMYSFVIQGAIKEASEREYNVLFSFIKDEYRGYEDLPKVVREKNVEGALFIQHVSATLHQELLQRGLATVAVDGHPVVRGLSAVYVDNERGAQIAAQHLLDLGHRNVAFLYASADHPSIGVRRQAFSAAVEGRGKKAKAHLIDAGELTFQAGYETALRVLAEQPRLTGIACANDELAAGVIRAGRELGRGIPKDLSVVGFDDIIMARYLDPPLTTIGYDKEALGRVAMGQLLDEIEKTGEAKKTPTVGCELVLRSSSGPPAS